MHTICMHVHACIIVCIYICIVHNVYTIYICTLASTWQQQKLQPARFCMYNTHSPTHTNTLANIYISLYAYTCVSVFVCIHIGWL